MKSYKLHSTALLAAAILAGCTTFVADAVKSAAARVDSFSDKLRARGLRKAAGTFDKMAAANKDEAVDCLTKASDLRNEGNRLFFEAEAISAVAQNLRAEAEDLDPQVLADYGPAPDESF